MAKQARIVVIGSLNMDLVICTPRIALEGETIIGSNFATMPGGKGANQAVAASRLGAKVEMVGCIGDDGFGKELIAKLKGECIGTDYVTTVSGVSSGVAMITVNESGENSIVVSPGANNRMTPAHVRQAEEIIRSADLVLVQLEIPMNVVEEAVRIANNHHVPIILNPAIDILTPNETEARYIATGQAAGVERYEEIIPKLKKKGVKQVVMTLGGDGAAYSVEDGVIHIGANKVVAVDTTGAGDAFNAGLAVYLGEGGKLDDAIRFAQKVAALSVTSFGAQSSMPSRSTFENLID
jgi:ribokinase